MFAGGTHVDGDSVSVKKKIIKLKKKVLDFFFKFVWFLKKIKDLN